MACTRRVLSEEVNLNLWSERQGHPAGPLQQRAACARALGEAQACSPQEEKEAPGAAEGRLRRECEGMHFEGSVLFCYFSLFLIMKNRNTNGKLQENI